jgi:hypothetical protein
MNRCYLFQGIRWTDAIFFKASVHPMPLPRHIAVEILWHNCSDAIHRQCVGSSGAEDSVLIQTERRIDQRCAHSDRRIIRCNCLRCFSSATRPPLLENGPSVHPTVHRVSPVYQLVGRLHQRLLFRYRRFIRWCLFFSLLARFWPLIFSFWHVIFLHPWDLVVSTKTC